MDYTLPGHPEPNTVKGRIVTLEFENLYVVGTYVVNAGTGLKVRSTLRRLKNAMANVTDRSVFALDPRCEEAVEHTF